MACRLVNRTSTPLRIDLRGGETLQLPPGATSAALAEEQLYDNMFIRQWERDGLIARLPARYQEVLRQKETAPAEPSGRKPPAGAKRAKAESRAAADKNARASRRKTTR